ncbi:hypothetical protein FT663_02690 [Candidozyma haemuli var. vulneris]|uniref:RNA polymerase II transcription factor B subunit 3 n=1 Tax=Candidozyma haemuli TaxID=45357 RepID=A0A2V1AXK7_9ASCO|nr:CDK-activating kinase assembly factor MAT1 [[Candida] haemuloni]KAF3987731.1 hypothetical protein FT662_03804 [[Candida] haemuloni var. vulneris]KAF3991504.1 hypothetical protein FT663_02690 [[Candida] haemuloni var. vulneris]PVH22817.1 CDK-activating kinase assembly factor MAT1 [[Candida] haemuloni]
MSALVDDNRSNDMCPICKTDRYLSPNMTFLINPECYHKICESCVDRIFSLGPAQCPYPKCNKMLRKNRFKKQVFDDIKIEREVDMRKRIHSIYNKSEEDFPDLKEYNAYLEYIENLIFNLSNGIDVEKTEEEVNKYEADHKIEILERAMRESEKDADITKYQEATERLKQEKLKIQRQMELEDMEFQQNQKQELMERLSSSDANAEEIMKEQRSQQAKRTNQRKRQLQQISNQLEQQFASANGSSKNGKDTAGNKTPFTPFQGDRDLQKHYSFLGASAEASKDSHDAYYDPFVNKLSKNKEYLGGGWRPEQVLERALDEAFMGLHCYVEKEKQHEVSTA